MLDTNATKALATTLAALTTARRRLRDALSAASAACGALGLDTSEDGRNPCDAASVGRNLAAAHRDATQAAADLSAVLGIRPEPTIADDALSMPSLDWLRERGRECSASIAALVASLDAANPPGGLPWGNAARARLALEVLRTCEHDDPQAMAVALESTAAVVRAEIEGTG